MEDVMGRLLEVLENPETPAAEFDEAARRVEMLKSLEQ